MNTSGISEMTLGDYWRVFRRRLLHVFIPFLALLVGAYWYGMTIPSVYEARALIEIQKNLIRSGMGLTRGFVSTFEKATMAKLATSRDVAALAARKLRHSLPDRYGMTSEEILAREIRAEVHVENLTQSNILQIRTVGSDPRQLADYCNAYAEAVVEFFENERRKSTMELKEYILGQIQAYDSKIAALGAKLQRVRNVKTPEGLEEIAVSKIATRANLNRIEEELERLVRERERLREKAENLRNARASGDFVKVAQMLGGRELESRVDEIQRLEKRRDQLLTQFTPAHPRVAKVIDTLNKAKEELKGVANQALEAYLLSNETREREIEQSLTRLEGERAMTHRAIEELPERLKNQTSLERELAIATSVSRMFQQKLQDFEISMNAPSDRLFLMERAAVPEKPIRPDRKMIVILGGIIGFLLGLAGAFLAEAIDTSLSALKDVERILERPVLAVVPRIRIPNEKLDTERFPTVRKDLLQTVPMMVDQRSPSAEAYRTLRAVIQRRFLESGFKTLLVTSSTPQEGKTTTIANLSLACAAAGLKTIVVGANMRHPVIGRFFPIDRMKGLHELLTGKRTLEDVIQETGFENLHIIDSGSFVRRPAEVLASSRFKEVLEILKKRYDIVLVDSPPMLPVADATTIAPLVDGVLLVYLVSVAPRDALLRCRETLEEVGANIIGVVFNDPWERSQNDYAGYYYHHRYAADEFSRL
ncbi:MAG: polysaccharide biosynthesis tyrosine autokinase [Candidatus Hydrogenedentota bacterium]|nr:MAG: polysaccharide biosynthesis tyrosine autokinase [Candidatus Hydrogenedentota bacterium]